MVTVVKGISGSGKSTRVYLLLSFLRSLGYNLYDYSFINVDGKSKVAGIFIKEFNLIFIGKLYERNGIECYQGYDVKTSYFGKSSDFSDFLRQRNEINFIIEGAGVTATNRLRPEFLYEYCGFSNIFMQYYNYNPDQYEQYKSRIILRSGKMSKTGTMWDKCTGFIADYEKSVSESKKILKSDESASINCFYNLFDEDYCDFGVKFLQINNLSQLIDSFVTYSDSLDYIRKNIFSND